MINPESQKALGQSVRRLWAGETLRFEYHEHSDRKPVDMIMKIANANGQQDLGLFTTPTIWVKKP